MKLSLLAAGGFGILTTAAVVACAASGEHEQTAAPDSGRGETAIPDAAGQEVDAGVEASTDVPICSKAGWCATTLPDVDLMMRDIWPLAEHAFAIAESATLGIKILEWTEADSTWRYIDDGSQNAPGMGTYAGKIWAPSDDEVYVGVGPGYVFHGRRPVAPATAWTWTGDALQDNGRPGSTGNPYYPKMEMAYPVLGVWGTSASDVHAWFKNTIYRWKADEAWVPEYAADDADADDEQLYFVGAAGTSPGDVWFSGARVNLESACALVVRKTAGGFERVADGTLSGYTCTPRAGALMIGGTDGWLTHLQAVAPGQFVGLKGASDPIRISVVNDDYVVDVMSIDRTALGLGESEPFKSLWSGSDALWLSTFGLVLRGTDVWQGGKLEASTIALNGAPILKTIFQIRGTSNTNLWAIGELNALHKKTP
jgi:hypothetical protein